MADEGQVIRGIDWRSTFSFTHIFRSFRIAIHLSKLGLGLALLLTVFFGGLVLDFVWPPHARAIPGEVAEYEQIVSGTDQTTLGAWRDLKRKDMDETYAQALAGSKTLEQGKSETDDAFHTRALNEAQQMNHVSELKDKIFARRDTAVKDAETKFKAGMNTAKTDEAKADLLKAKNAAVADAYDTAENDLRGVESIKGMGLFHAFFDYEIFQITGVVKDGVLRNNWVDAGGVKDHLYNFFAIGPIWLIWNHTIFFILFAALFLLAWAFFGGAICRIAAIHFARDEKISVRQAMNFAAGKLLSFASAPVIPLAIVIVIGLLVALASLVGVIPFLGPIVVGALFILPLVAGFVMTLVLLGTAGGFNLMYPTIAVEGSDSFDAISRSFSYVYARPWRMLFYTVVALIYGAATYLFVHMFIWLTLVLTHHFVGMGMFTNADSTKNLLNTMWPNPLDTGRISYSADYYSLTAGQKIGAFFMNCWVMFLVSFLGAFAISLYFSANTIVYYLMRNEVDSTELDDVYLEQSEEDMEPAMGASPVVAVTTETTVVTGTAPVGGDSPQPT